MKQTLSSTIKGLVKENYKAENKRLKRERDAKEAELNLEKEVRNALGFSIKSMINKNTQHKEPKTPSDSSFFSCGSIERALFKKPSVTRLSQRICAAVRGKGNAATIVKNTIKTSPKLVAKK